MSTAEELKALGNKAIAAKNFDEAISPRPSRSIPPTTSSTATDQQPTRPRRSGIVRSPMPRKLQS
ncbi:uncharacterized protein THITE_2122198 [Thermothielavioides terrestris NRRL 8126]|uniref:Uncharacterized protein n=1 Tax=Thermothielavioides terrestris (strain ATCC 38088 / NRRL 8126) TaxID=578455 RepID=G2RCD2_THETT|nr:uncharacterized protein THITE_2122198 [Thermothielavioides terrestris NRRL 8126]AEO70567.1 hypothetical protein THITE_2122198 [Thermothielavioides terrestris NRRL 8126]